MRVWLCVFGSAWAVAVLTLSAVTAISPQRNGLLALAEIGAPFLLLSLLPFAVPAVWPLPLSRARVRRWVRVLRLCLVVALGVAVVRFGSVWVSIPPRSADADAIGTRVGVTSWNLETGQADPEAVIQQLRQAPKGVVGLVELAPANANPIRADDAVRALFPYQLLFPSDGSLGMGLLSSYPILESGRVKEDPPIIWARLDLGEGRTLSVVAAHPLPAQWHTLGSLPIPVDFDATTRDAQIRTLRETVDRLLVAGRPLILAGDFNVTDREPAYADLSRGLLDAHLETGLGPGSTWRPDEIKWLPLGIIRIDMAFGGNGVRPVSMAVDCTPHGSDHCFIRVSMALP